MNIGSNMNMNNIHTPPFPTSQLNNNLQSVQLLLASTSSLLRTLVMACIAFNFLLFMSSFLTLGARYVGMSTFFASLVSCAHTVGMAVILSPHISNNEINMNASSMSGHQQQIHLVQFDQILQYASNQYSNNPLAYGTIMGGTFMLVPLMQAISAYFGGIASCVANHGTGHNMHMLHNNTTSSSSAHYFDSYGICGASGPVHFVSFLSSILSWMYLAIAILLYTRRRELLEGQISGIGGGSYQYDEIGESADGAAGSVGRGTFAGDFPGGGAGGANQGRVLQV